MVYGGGAARSRLARRAGACLLHACIVRARHLGGSLIEEGEEAGAALPLAVGVPSAGHGRGRGIEAHATVQAAAGIGRGRGRGGIVNIGGGISIGMKKTRTNGTILNCHCFVIFVI